MPHNGSDVTGTQSEWCVEQGKGQDLDREEGSQAVKPALGSKTAQQEKALGTSLITWDQTYNLQRKGRTNSQKASSDPHAWGGIHTPPTHTLIKINFKTNRNLHIYTNFNLHVWYDTCNLHTLTSFINTQLRSCINTDFLKTPPSGLSLRISFSEYTF